MTTNNNTLKSECVHSVHSYMKNTSPLIKEISNVYMFMSVKKDYVSIKNIQFNTDSHNKHTLTTSIITLKDEMN